MKDKTEKSIEVRYAELQEVVDKLRIKLLSSDPDRLEASIKKECEANRGRLNGKIKEYNVMINIAMNGLTNEQRSYISLMRLSGNESKLQIKLVEANRGIKSVIKKSKKEASIANGLNVSLKKENDSLKKSVNSMSAERSRWMRKLKRIEAKQG